MYDPTSTGERIMKNRLPFAALTFAFTIAGACLGYTQMRPEALCFLVGIVAFVGAIAAASSGDNL